VAVADPVSAPRRRTLTIPLPRMAASGALTIGVALGIAATAFAAAGGLRLERTTYVLIAMMLGGASLVAAALIRRPRTADAPLYGGGPLLAFGLLAALTAMSVTWSLAPAESWVEANRTFAYLAVFAGGIALARLMPERVGALLAGVGAGCLIVTVWALMTKVFPASLAADETYARLREPFAYWNSVGLMAALGVPPMLWLAARRTGHAAANALAWPAIGLLLVCLMLSYSRGALAALIVGVAAWFILVPLRLRATVALAAGVIGEAPVVAWAFSQDGLTTDEAPMAARVDAGHEFGTLLVLMAALLLAAGIAVHFAASQRPPTPHQRRIAGRAAVGVLALLPVVALIALASAPGGIDGQVSSAWSKLTDPDAQTPANTPGRFTAASSVRARYWDEALHVHAESPWIGTGAGAYAVARNRFRDTPLAVRHAHGYGVQTLADLGWVGLFLSLVAAAAWLVAAARATGITRRDRGRPYDAERVGLLTLVTVVIVFGVHSLVDWTWFVPANAGVALLCAGWVVGRGPLRNRPAAPPEPEPAPAHESRLAWLRRELPPVPTAAAALVMVIALAAAWTAFQPVRAVNAGDAAFDRLDRGQIAAAADIAQIATDRNPLSVEPLFELAAIEELRGRDEEAEAALERAVRLQPANAETWRRLGRFRLSALGQADEALRAFRAAYYLDPAATQSTSDVLEASRAAGTTPSMPTP
jgi:O-antigen ligase/polysaccharide polymerase Wzy-like membrane protein/tetratricopeptide repeat protein